MESEDNSQNQQGLRDTNGTGVFVISACIGESARNARTTVMTSTSSQMPISYAGNPWEERQLRKRTLSNKCTKNIKLTE